jgi:hypothetical protein
LSCHAEAMETLTTVEAFEAMRSFEAQFARREPEASRERFAFLLSWTEREGDLATADPAQWDDWLKSVADARTRIAEDRRLTIP